MLLSGRVIHGSTPVKEHIDIQFSASRLRGMPSQINLPFFNLMWLY